MQGEQVCEYHEMTDVPQLQAIVKMQAQRIRELIRQVSLHDDAMEQLRKSSAYFQEMGEEHCKICKLKLTDEIQRKLKAKIKIDWGDGPSLEEYHQNHCSWCDRGSSRNCNDKMFGPA